MNDSIKYAKSDILDGLKSLKVGLTNIVSNVINTGEQYTINLPITFVTLSRLIVCLVKGAIVDFWGNSTVFYIYVNNKTISVTVNKNEYTFNLVG